MVGVVEQREALPPVLRERLRRLRVVLAPVADGAPEVGPHAVAPHRALLVATHRVPEKVLRAQDPPPADHLDGARSTPGERGSQKIRSKQGILIKNNFRSKQINSGWQFNSIKKGTKKGPKKGPKVQWLRT